MRILITGSSGLIGSALLPVLERAGHEAVRMVRRDTGPVPATLFWDPPGGKLPEPSGFDAVIHLAGAPIGRRWSEDYKRELWTSRVDATRHLAERLAGAERPPAVLLSASAIGYYGERGAAILTEDDPAGLDYLARLCAAWEDATAAASEAGIRVVHMRIGIVLSGRGGAIPPLALAFRVGLGGRFGRGRAYWSWISIHDVVGAILHLLVSPGAGGPFNLTAPDPVTNAELARTLGRVLHRPALLPIPPVALRIVRGREQADEAILKSQRVVPARLMESGYRFVFADLASALREATDGRA